MSSDGRWITIEVAPKVDAADVFRMIDCTSRELPEIGDLDSEIAIGKADVSAVFLSFFVRQLRQFLKTANYRNYRFVERNRPSGVRGRPLIAEYVFHNLPRGRGQCMPSRHLELTSDVLENQVLAYTVEIARRLVSIFELDSRPDLVRALRTCREDLAGVTQDE